MANTNKHLKESNNRIKKEKRAGKKTAPKEQQNKNEKFNFDNEIVIGVNVVHNPKRDKSSSNKKNNNVTKNNKNKVVKTDYKKHRNKKEIEDKKNKGNTPRKPKKVNFKKIIKFIILLAIIIGSIVFIMTTPLFYVTNVEIEGNSRITNDRINSLSKISLNVNTFQYSKNAIKKYIAEEPYINNVQVKRKLPNTIIINVEERTRDFIIYSMGSYIYINKQGYILEVTNEPENLPEIKGFTTSEDKLTPGNRLSNEDLEKLNTTMEIINTIKNNEINSYIDSINVEDKNDYTIIMKEENKKIHLGNASNINDRILMLKEILTKEKGKTGEVFIKELNKVYFREANWVE